MSNGHGGSSGGRGPMDTANRRRDWQCRRCGHARSAHPLRGSCETCVCHGWNAEGLSPRLVEVHALVREQRLTALELGEDR